MNLFFNRLEIMAKRLFGKMPTKQKKCDYAYRVVGHVDSVDRKGRFTVFYVYKLVVTSGDKVAQGEFQISKRSRLSKVRIDWRTGSDANLSNKLTDHPKIINGVLKGKASISTNQTAANLINIA